MTVWVTTDRKRLVRRTVVAGLQQDGLHQILDGLEPGELIATDGALFSVTPLQRHRGESLRGQGNSR